MDNAASLIEDASVLASHSPGRARSLLVLAQEELGKALWIYETFESAWTKGDDSPRAVERLRSHGRSHVSKYLEAMVFGDELYFFWGEYEKAPKPDSGESWPAFFERRASQANAASEEANRVKQGGFYVDIDSEKNLIFTPGDAKSDGLAGEISHAARVIEMLLIKDHTRTQDLPGGSDSAQDKHWRLLPYAHPKEFFEWSDSGSDEPPAGGAP